jgi:hypothetical protein
VLTTQPPFLAPATVLTAGRNGQTGMQTPDKSPLVIIGRALPMTTW